MCPCRPVTCQSGTVPIEQQTQYARMAFSAQSSWVQVYKDGAGNQDPGGALNSGRIPVHLRHMLFAHAMLLLRHLFCVDHGNGTNRPSKHT